MKGSLDGDVFIKHVRLIAQNNHLLFAASLEEIESYRTQADNLTQSRRVPPTNLSWLPFRLTIAHSNDELH
jgi:hypothetical protein